MDPGKDQDRTFNGRTQMNANISYLDGNAAGGELSRIFTVDLTAAEGHVRIAEQRGALPMLICMWIVLAWLRGVLCVTMSCFGS